MGKNPNQEALKRARYIRVKGSPYSWEDDLWGVVKEHEDTVQERLDAYAKAVIDRIQSQYRAINEHSANRGRGFLAVRYNGRFENDPAPHISVTKTEHGKSIQIEVDDPLYNILDQGRKDKEVTRRIRFPRYKRYTSTTLPGPNQVTMDTATMKYGNTVMEDSWVELVPGKTLYGFKPRKLLSIAAQQAIRNQNKTWVRAFAKLGPVFDAKGNYVDSHTGGTDVYRYQRKAEFWDLDLSVVSREERRNYKAEQRAKKAEEKRQALEKELEKRSRKKK